MLSFHNDAAIKQKYLDRVKHHQELDNIIQGTGWEKGKGCAVGCTLEAYDHSRYPIELGIPEWMAHLEDKIFEYLPKKEAKEWPYKFLNAVPVGLDLEPLKHKLAIRRLTRLIKLQEENLAKNSNLEEVINQTIAAMKAVMACHEAELNNLICDWSAAWSEAESAAESARSATSSAWSATSSAWSAAWSAWSATWSAARSAAESAAWEQEAEDLIYLLQEIKNEK